MNETPSVDLKGEPLQTQALTGNLDLGGGCSNKAAGRSAVVRLVCDGTSRTLAWNSDWVFIGEKPASIAANKTALLSVTCFGTAETDIVCSYAVQD